MPENRNLQKSDIETIIQVNNKAIELQNEISDQYEDILSTMTRISMRQDNIERDIVEIRKESKEIAKTQFKVLVILSSGIVSLIFQIFNMFKK